MLTPPLPSKYLVKHLLAGSTLLLTAVVCMGQTGPGGVGSATNYPFWLDGASILQANGTAVATWPNSGSNALDAVQGTGTNQPTFQTGQLNGLPAISFDGGSDFLSIGNNNDLNNGGPHSQRTFFMVIRTGANVNNRQIIYEEGGNSRGLNMYIFMGQLYLGGFNTPSDGAGAPWTGFTNTGVTANTTYVLSFIYNGNATTTGTITGFLNGNPFVPIPNVGQLYDHNSAEIGSERSQTIYHDGAATGNGKYFGGLIAEFLNYNFAVNAAQRVIVENYLAAKYELTIASDVYVMDDPGNGNYDREMAGIGMVDASNAHTDAQSGSFIRINNPAGLDAGDYLMWGHDNGDPGFVSNTSDVPAGVGSRMNRVWRATQPDPITSYDVTVSTGCSIYDPDVYLLIDTDGDGLFTDETLGVGVRAMTSSTPGEHVLTGLTTSLDGLRFTIGFGGQTTDLDGFLGPAGVADNTGNRFWYDASTISQASGTTVSNWVNIGGNAAALTQSSAGARPQFLTNQVNSQPAVRFDGTNDVLRIADNNDLNIGGPYSQRTFSFAFTTGAEVSTRRVIYEEGGGTRGMNLYVDGGSLYAGAWNLGADGGDAPWGFVSLNTSVDAATTYVVTIIFSGNSCMTGSFELFVDGTSVGSVPNIGRLYAHSGDIGIGAKSNDTYYHDGASTGDGDYFNGSLSELIIYTVALYDPHRVMVENYLAAKYQVDLDANDLFTMDDDGDYDGQMFGIGKINALESEEDAQGRGIVRFLNATALTDNEFMMAGHDNGLLNSNDTDVPAGVQARFIRTWRVSEVTTAGTATDVGSIDIRFDLSAHLPVVASDLRLLIDDENDGFADETPISGATSLGSNVYQFAGISGLSDGFRFTLGTTDIIQTPLPVELIAFEARQVEEGVRLDWTTATELNNDFFTLQRSTNALSWTDVAVIDGAGTTSITTDYSLIDTVAPVGRIYYRMKQTDFDGTSELSHVISVDVYRSLSNFAVYPNPSSGLIVVRGTRSELDAISFINSAGLHVSLPGTRVSENELHLDVSSLPQGIYLIKTSSHTTRVVVE